MPTITITDDTRIALCYHNAILDGPLQVTTRDMINVSCSWTQLCMAISCKETRESHAVKDGECDKWHILVYKTSL